MPAGTASQEARLQARVPENPSVPDGLSLRGLQVLDHLGQQFGEMSEATNMSPVLARARGLEVFQEFTQVVDPVLGYQTGNLHGRFSVGLCKIHRCMFSSFGCGCSFPRDTPVRSPSGKGCPEAVDSN
jgi:hypothetical protein